MVHPFGQSFAKLTPAPRAFLFFSLINLVSWQCIVGQVLVLFARALEMPPDLVGLLISFIPISLLIVIVGVPAVEFFGPRKLLISSWIIRYCIISSVFLIPAFSAASGRNTAWHILLWAVLGFSLARAFGVSAWYPWLHEIVPRNNIGDYFNTETILVQVTNIMLAFLVARVLAQSDGLSAFYLVYGAGLCMGAVSITLLVFMPGGRKKEDLSSQGRGYESFRGALADKPYRQFIGLVSFALSSLMWVGSASVMYLRDIMLFPDGSIMYITAIGGVAVALTVRYWSNLAEQFGNNRSMARMLVLHAASVSFWFVLLPGSSLGFVIAVAALVSSMVFSTGVSTVASRAMLALVKTEGRTGYTSLWIIGVSIANGIPPILAGQLIRHFGLFGFRLCFVISVVIGIGVSFFLKRLPEAGEMPDIPHLDILVRPLQPFRWVARTAWVGLGFGIRRQTPSARPLKEKPDQHDT